MSFGSCSKDNVEEVDNVAKNVCFKVEVRTGGYGTGTRAAGPSKDDGTLADDENEKAVYNATLFIYQNDKGINGAADTPIYIVSTYPTSQKTQNTLQATEACTLRPWLIRATPFPQATTM